MSIGFICINQGHDSFAYTVKNKYSGTCTIRIPIGTKAGYTLGNIAASVAQK